MRARVPHNGAEASQFLETCGVVQAIGRRVGGSHGQGDAVGAGLRQNSHGTAQKFTPQAGTLCFGGNADLRNVGGIRPHKAGQDGTGHPFGVAINDEERCGAEKVATARVFVQRPQEVVRAEFGGELVVYLAVDVALVGPGDESGKGIETLRVPWFEAKPGGGVETPKPRQGQPGVARKQSPVKEAHTAILGQAAKVVGRNQQQLALNPVDAVCAGQRVQQNLKQTRLGIHASPGGPKVHIADYCFGMLQHGIAVAGDLSAVKKGDAWQGTRSGEAADLSGIFGKIPVENLSPLGGLIRQQGLQLQQVYLPQIYQLG